MTRPFIYSERADADLREITRYTRKHWGPAQARTYARQIDAAASEVAQGQGVFKDWSTVLPDLRVKAVGSHCIFCLPRPGRPALILAILHERMDLMARLQDRLRV